MAILVVLHPLLRKLYDYCTMSVAGKQVSPEVQGDLRLKQRVSYDLMFLTAFLIGLHGFSAFKVLFILYMNYAVARSLPRSYIPAATWIFNIGGTMVIKQK